MNPSDGPWHPSEPSPMTGEIIITNPQGRVIARVPHRNDATFICRAREEYKNPAVQQGRLGALLDSAMEHGSHAWRALEIASGVTEAEDGAAWPPSTDGFEVGSVGYHLAALLNYVKQAYDRIPRTSYSDPG